jgi:hypothetical protein
MMGDARLTAETLGHRGLGSVSGYTKITDQRRCEAHEQMQRHWRMCRAPPPGFCAEEAGDEDQDYKGSNPSSGPARTTG